MLMRVIRRSPWIAVGAAGAWLFDPQQGPQRRERVQARAREMIDELKGGAQRQVNRAAEDLSLEPQVASDNVASRASGLLPEESSAGVGTAGSAGLAGAVLDESEQRTVDREKGESRASSDTVPPTPAPSRVGGR
jgi:hypothetical protein